MKKEVVIVVANSRFPPVTSHQPTQRSAPPLHEPTHNLQPTAYGPRPSTHSQPAWLSAGDHPYDSGTTRQHLAVSPGWPGRGRGRKQNSPPKAALPPVGDNR